MMSKKNHIHIKSQLLLNNILKDSNSSCKQQWDLNWRGNTQPKDTDSVYMGLPLTSSDDWFSRLLFQQMKAHILDCHRFRKPWYMISCPFGTQGNDDLAGSVKKPLQLWVVN